MNQKLHGGFLMATVKLTIEVTADTVEEAFAQVGQALEAGTLDAQVEGKKGPGRGRRPAAAAATTTPAATAAAPAGPAELNLDSDVLPHIKSFAEKHGVQKTHALSVKHGAPPADPRAAAVPKANWPAYVAEAKAALTEAPATAASSDLV
jgi:hypothetical protein